eukprot:m.90140 g.90140  ORF g.90140 m.90140 type:complete len:1008 (-) comp9843_c0_seq1:96-3119(-)
MPKVERSNLWKLQHAIGRNRLDEVQELVTADTTLARQELEDSQQTPPLLLAVQKDKPDIVRTLLEAQADPTQQDKRGTRPVDYCVQRGKSQCLQALIEGGVDVTLPNKDGRPPFLEAAYRGSLSVVKTLLAADGVDVSLRDKKQRTALMTAVDRNHVDCVKALLEDGRIDVNAVDEKGNAAINEASVETVQLLLDANANPNVAGEDTLTPLIRATQHQQLPLLEVLLPHCDVNAVTKDDGKTALIWATMQEDPKMTQLLIDAGADVNAKDSSQMTALVWSIMQHRTPAFDVLLAAGADVNLGSINGWTPLFWAVQQDEMGMLKKLMDAGADLEAADMSGQTALVWAAESAKPEACKLLVEGGANRFAERADKQTALSIARAKDLVDVIAVLGDAEDRLTIAAGQGDEDTVAKILKEEPEVNMNLQDKDGRTPVVAATYGGHKRVAEMLVDAGANLDLADNAGNSVADINPWLVVDAVTRGVTSRLEPLPTAAAFLTAVQAYPIACVFVADTLGLSDRATDALQTEMADKLKDDVERRKHHRLSESGQGSDRDGAVTLHDTAPIDALLTQFVDAPLERLRAVKPSQRWNGTLTVPTWLNRTVVPAAYAAFRHVMDRKVATLTAREVDMYRDDAAAALADDRSIYTAVFLKMINKHPDAAARIKQNALDARALVKRTFTKRPTQPDLVVQTATILDLKVQAANVAKQFDDFVMTSMAKLGVSVTVAPVLKKSARMIQKWWLRKDVVTICDVVRALVMVPDFPTMLRVHDFLVHCTTIELVDFKDRVNQPTSGGWADLVYLFRFPQRPASQGQGQGQATGGHICELQLALEPMVTARSSLHGHAAYAQARHKMEILEAQGIDVEDIRMSSLPSPNSSHTHNGSTEPTTIDSPGARDGVGSASGGTSHESEPEPDTTASSLARGPSETLEQHNARLMALCTQLMDSNRSLRTDLDELKRQYGLVDASSPARSRPVVVKKKKRSFFSFGFRSSRESSGESPPFDTSGESTAP